MVRMMTYKEANSRLNSSLTPNNKCICKYTAIHNNAQQGPLQRFANNRLVPVSVVIKKYFVVFKDENGNVLSQGYYEPGEALNDPGVPSKTGYNGAWNNGYTGYATGDAVYSPQYTAIEYDITFMYDSNTLWKTESYAYGATPDPGVPSLDGQVFDGWSPSISTVTGPATYVATWHSASSTVTYIVYGIDDSIVDQYTESVTNGSTPSNYPSPAQYANYDGYWNPSNPANTTIYSDTTFVYRYSYTAPPVTMLADVGWKTADAGQGTPHGDPSNLYEVETDWIPSNKMPVHVWFEPMYTSNGTELSYDDPIAEVNGVTVSHNDLTWSASLGTSSQGYDYWDDGTYGRYKCLIICPQQLHTEDEATNRNWRVTVESNSDELYWMDTIPFTLTASYNGTVVYQKEITIVCYKYSIAYAGYTSPTYKGSKQGWVKNWNLN